MPDQNAPMITLYGSSKGRASRSLVALEELGLAYGHVPLAPWSNEADRETLRTLNPNARVPVLKDGDLVLWESMAINLYLGDKVGGPLVPTAPSERGRMYQWSVWGQTSIDVMARHLARFGKDPERKARAEAERLAALAVLDGALAKRDWLATDAFSLADLNVATTLVEPWETGIDGELDPAATGLPHLAAWLTRCTTRDSWAKVREMP